MAAFRTIRAHHRAERVAALTTRPYRLLLETSGYFDEILVDDRPKPWRAAAWLRLVGRLRRRRFARVYDLQRNARTAILYRAIGLGRVLEWSGVVRGASHFVRDDPADHRHISERLAEQLAVAGIAPMRPLDLGWLSGEAGRFGLPARYCLIAAGGAPHRPEKRAPTACFAALGRHFVARGIAPVLLGTEAERRHIEAIVAACPGAFSLCGRTSFGDIADLARGAVGAVGNDTGIMHLAAAVGCPSLVLFFSASDPRRVRPLGRRVSVLETATPEALQPERLIAAWEELGDDGSSGGGRDHLMVDLDQAGDDGLA